MNEGDTSGRSTRKEKIKRKKKKESVQSNETFVCVNEPRKR